MSRELEDPFLATFFSRIPTDVAASFSALQLDAVRRAFGARTPGAHAIDLRFSIPFGSRSFYCVLLAGKERRTHDRLAMERLFRPLWNVANAAIIACLLIMLATSLFTAGYVTKRALNIDVFPGIDMLPDRTIERLLR